MKNFDLNNYGVQEMNAVEMKEIDGGVGVGFIIIAGIAVGMILRAVFTDRGAYINDYYIP